MGTIEIIVENGAGSTDAVQASIALTGLSIAQQPAQLSNLAYANHVASSDLGAKAQVAHQDAMNRVRLATLSSAVRRASAPGPEACRAAVSVCSGNALAELVADLKVAMDAFEAS